MFYHTDSPRTDKLGSAPNATDGALMRDTDREIFYAPVFVENRFDFGRFSITPGLRLENLWQSVEENVNVAKTGAGTPLGDESEYEFVPLVGLGLEYELKPEIVAYGNVSQSYRPKIFTQAVPTGGGAIANDDLEEGKSWQYEIGLRGNPAPYFNWDVSAFLMDFDDQIGTVGGVVQNVGRAIHKGVEGAFEVDLVGFYDSLRQTDYVSQLGSLSLYANAMLLDAEIVDGVPTAPVPPAVTPGTTEGNTPQYAADYIIRTGLIYRWRDRVKVALLGTFVDDHWANDNNGRFVAANPASSGFVPSYTVWDLTMEAKVHRNVTLLAGINNLFDEDYYARIRNDGIDPAYGRNFYAGLSLQF
jgi:Fe(3+) dicitrate transport protein